MALLTVSFVFIAVLQYADTNGLTDMKIVAIYCSTLMSQISVFIYIYMKLQVVRMQ